MKTAKISSIIISLLLTTLAVGCAASDAEAVGEEDDGVDQTDNDLTGRKHVITKSDDGKLITVNVGSAIAVELPANPTTGFDWSMDSETGDNNLGTPKRTFDRGASSVGSGGMTTLTWSTTATRRGEHTVKLAYKRSFGSGAPENTFTLRVRVVERCGGIANIGCKHASETCAEDPMSTCSPGAGGADCMGICKP